MCAKWQGQPPINMLGFFCKNLDATEFCFPTMAFVLSMLKLAQLFHGISSASNDSSIASKKFEALPASSSLVKQILKKMFRHYFRVLNIKYSHWNKVHLLYTSIISSIMANTERIAFTVVNKQAVTVWLKCCINYDKSFCFGTCVWCRNFAIRENVFKELCKMISSCNGQVILNNKVCDHNFPI